MAKKLQEIRATDKLKAMAEVAEVQFAKQSYEAKEYELISIRDRLLLLALKLPKKLMIHTDASEGTFTIDFLNRLTDEQLADLNKAVNLHEVEDVFLYFYMRREGKRMPTIELNEFENFDFGRVLETTINGNTVSLIEREDLPPTHYVSVTFHVA